MLNNKRKKLLAHLLSLIIFFSVFSVHSVVNCFEEMG
jgi:hypothetical protein